MESTITTEQQGNLSCHFVRTGCDWGRVVIAPAHSLVMCYSSCGNYNFSWHAPGEEFTQFLNRLPFDYAMSKFLGAERELDVERSARLLREHICQSRRDATYSAEVAREMWAAVADALTYTDSEFTDHLATGAFARHAGYGKWYDYLSYGHGPQARHFWNLIWRPLMNHLTTLK